MVATLVLRLQLGQTGIYLHFVFETLAYFAGFAIYRWTRAKRSDHISTDYRWWIIAAAALGAAFGSRLLGVLEEAPGQLSISDANIPSGKTIVGGLVGGWIAVEVIKLRLKINVSTGDLFAVPITVGIAIGRVGCLLAGLPDQTYGEPTALPWGIDFGDGVFRHPTQLYEIVFLGILSCVLWRLLFSPHRNGQVFKLFMLSYASWRLLIDFLKPGSRLFGLSVIQWTCLCVLLYYFAQFIAVIRMHKPSSADPQRL